jgi:hypothetical protein
VLAVALTGGLLVRGFVWWKTRELRKQTINAGSYR